MHPALSFRRLTGAKERIGCWPNLLGLAVSSETRTKQTVGVLWCLDYQIDPLRHYPEKYQVGFKSFFILAQLARPGLNLCRVHDCAATPW